MPAKNDPGSIMNFKDSSEYHMINAMNGEMKQHTEIRTTTTTVESDIIELR